MLAVASAVALVAQDAVIGDVKHGIHNNEKVALSGKIVPGPRIATQSVQSYYLEDRFNDVILIRTTEDLPPLNAAYRVIGVAQIDADTHEVFVVEQHRQPLESPPAPPPGGDTKTILLIGGLAAALIAIAIFLTRRRSSPSAFVSDTGDPAPVPPASGVDDFKTVRVYKTTKILPGTLVVMNAGKETDIIYLSDQSGRGEVEIGRDSPGVSGGIRIKDRTNTVSRRQARLAYSADTREFQVVNLATEEANPTTLNGKALRTDESAILGDGDLVGMGTLEVKFRKK